MRPTAPDHASTADRPQLARVSDVGDGSGVGYIDLVPLYEYRCTTCRKRTTVLTLRASEEVRATCEHCGGTALERLLSRFAMVRSEDARLDSLANPSQLGDLDERDPKSMARWMRRMGSELGDELGGNELDEMVDEMESTGAGGDDEGDAGGGDDE
jgi:putative FmdB family regulatory protein